RGQPLLLALPGGLDLRAAARGLLRGLLRHVDLVEHREEVVLAVGYQAGILSDLVGQVLQLAWAAAAAVELVGVGLQLRSHLADLELQVLLLGLPVAQLAQSLLLLGKRRVELLAPTPLVADLRQPRLRLVSRGVYGLQLPQDLDLPHRPYRI